MEYSKLCLHCQSGIDIIDCLIKDKSYFNEDLRLDQEGYYKIKNLNNIDIYKHCNGNGNCVCNCNFKFYIYFFEIFDGNIGYEFYKKDFNFDIYIQNSSNIDNKIIIFKSVEINSKEDIINFINKIQDNLEFL